MSRGLRAGAKSINNKTTGLIWAQFFGCETLSAEPATSNFPSAGSTASIFTPGEWSVLSSTLARK